MVRATGEVRVLLPLALAPGDTAVRRVPLDPPPALGVYEVSLAPAASAELVLARRRVTVVP